MPELPECESVVRKIRPRVWGCEIIGFMRSNHGKLPDVVQEQVAGQTINHIGRLGKYIVFKLDDGYLISHLRMTGQWEFTDADQPGPNANKHFRWALSIRGHDGEFAGFLWFKDVRRFGTLVWVKELLDYPAFEKLGPDGLALEDKKNVFQVMSRAKRTRRPIKNFILDQKVIAGVGNIYASEALFATRIDPTTPTKQVPPSRIKELCSNLVSIFRQAIELGGSSISDHGGGEYQNILKVYGRDGEPCYECGTTIEKLTQAGRGTFLCPKCQGGEEHEHS